MAVAMFLFTRTNLCYVLQRCIDDVYIKRFKDRQDTVWAIKRYIAAASIGYLPREVGST
jgi:hypothetical protein